MNNMTFQLMTAIREARTFLFVPGNRPDRFTKAMASAADAVVFDLEDSVPLQGKVSARAAIAEVLPELCGRRAAVVRINALRSSLGQDDLDWLASCGKEVAVMVPKADSAAQLMALHARLPDSPLLPLIESADGYAALNEVAGVSGVARLVLGTVDFMVDLGMQCDMQETQLTPLRFATTVASRRFGLSAPVDGVTLDINDGERLREDTLRTLQFGFGAKLCIHPAQIEIVHEALAPTALELEWARRVVEQDQRSGGAAVQMDGRMIDAPVVAQARRLLSRVSRS